MTGMGLDHLESMVGALLAKERLPTPERIREIISRVRAACPHVTDDEAEQLARNFEATHGVTMDVGVVLQEEFEPWLDQVRPTVNTYYWERYRRYLASQSLSGHVLSALDEVTDRTLALLENPAKPGKWDRRGMVVGNVQSGKTANYTALICKAADVGYKVIVVIAGIHNNLRTQTQVRIDEGFVGFDSSRMLAAPRPDKRVGVGLFDPSRRPATFTNTQRDFNRMIATSIGIPLENLTEPAVFVVKKNASTLGNMLSWLAEHNSRHDTSTISSPMLLIDDEADNASINIKGPDEVSRINSQIRKLLSLFGRKCYIGYTATPFANIFIDPDSEDEMIGDDLFPRDFIIGLDPPSNYFGPARLFRDSSSDVVRHIDDNEDILPLVHPIDLRVSGLPDSLTTAIRVFIVARAIRLARGQVTAHNSMLVNVSRFVEVQRQLRHEIHETVDRIRRRVRTNSGKTVSLALRDPEITALKQAFDEEYADASDVSWPDIQDRLWDSVSRTNVIEVNSRSSGSLNYTEHTMTGFNVIAVGGFSLSRGLTLEGLIVSYFLRNSMMYDTLMQMGRWFGYRDGYDDLCRVWMLEDAEGWYTHIAESTEELRDELRRMEGARATPAQFGLKVRSHPDTLIVTARNKMRSGRAHVVSIGLANNFIETTVLRRDPNSLEANRLAATKLAEDLRTADRAPEQAERFGGGRLVRDAPASAVLAFLATFRNHEGCVHTDPRAVRQYIEQRAADELAGWDILIAGVQRRTKNDLLDSGMGIEIVCQRRQEGRRSDGATLLVSNKARVASRGAEKAGLDSEQAKAAEQTWEARQAQLPERERSTNVPDREYRQVRTRPLFILHMLAMGAEGDNLSRDKPVVAWSISFPNTLRDERKVEYTVNTVWWRERYGDQDAEEEEANDDEE